MQFAADGFEIFENVLTSDEVAAVIADLPASGAGLRNVLQRIPAVRSIVSSAALTALLHRLGQPDARPVRALLFDKHPAKNWAVPWHQDVAIAVAGPIDTPGFRAWSVKDGVPHVQPPAAVLEAMLTLRLHLDDCDASNGALRVIPGSHRHGLLTDADTSRLTAGPEHVCTVRRGGVLAMRPLLLHASSRATTPTHRRVLHLEFASAPLPNGLRWFEDTAGNNPL